MRDISLGLDPEYFIFDKKGNLKSAIEIINGTKENPLQLNKDNCCYWDNVLVEIRVKPCSSADEVVNNLRDCYQALSDHLNPYLFKPQASNDFPEKELKHPKAKEFGCSPEYCTYDMCINKPVVCNNNFRTGGGHIHVGFDDGFTEDMSDTPIMMNKNWCIRAMDLLIGIPSLFLDKDPTSKKRRKLYGGAGSHRVPSYGFEYRTLSNFWLRNPEYVRLIFELSKHAVELGMSDDFRDKIWDGDIVPDDLKNTINNWDDERAVIYLDKIKKYIPKKLYKEFENLTSLKYNDSVNDFYKNWSIVAG